MIITTTPSIEGHPVKEYKGIVTSEVIIGANAIRDFMAGIRDFFGGRSRTYETVGSGNSMLMVVCSGTAVVI